MKYPVLLQQMPGSSDYKITVPDLLGCQEKAETIDNALSKINLTIASHLSILAEYGEHIPHGSLIESHKSRYPNAIWAIVDIDITPYLGKSHKINVTMPELLLKQMDDKVSKTSAYKTRSGFIAAACLNELSK
jgi:predicted RNase H-like HicB family nuclease